MQFERHPDPQTVAVRAVELVAETVRSKPAAVLLLPAGATPVPFYAELVRHARAAALDLSRAHLFQLDELLGVAPADPRSFQAFFRQHLVRPLDLGARFQGLDGTAGDPEREIERHRRVLAERGPADLALLGLGRNGHVAFNEPGSALDDPARLVQLGALTLEGLRHAFPNDCPERGLTLGLAEIAASARIVMLVTGASKAEMLGRVLAGEPSRERPATLLARHPRFLLLADEAAARRAAPTRS
jgi:glucosamine-6-phosphate deaminase